MISISINPAYKHLRSFIESVPERFGEGRLIYGGRNEIRVFNVSGKELNVKRYRVPAFFNRLVYSFFRKPKGERAFEYPALLAAAGIDTPEAIAYIEERRGGLIAYSYFISPQISQGKDIYWLGDADPAGLADFIHDFARFAARMHEAGVLHLDFSPGNILCCKAEDGTWHFTVIDINRMRFGAVDVRRGCENFARLWGQPGFFRALAREYAAVRGADPEQCERWTMEARNRFWRRFSKHHNVCYNLVY